MLYDGIWHQFAAGYQELPGGSERTNAIYETWEKGMATPNIKISSIGVRFLRTTNTLIPDADVRVIDINGKSASVRKGIVLVSDVLEY